MVTPTGRVEINRFYEHYSNTTGYNPRNTEVTVQHSSTDTVVRAMNIVGSKALYLCMREIVIVRPLRMYF